MRQAYSSRLPIAMPPENAKAPHVSAGLPNLYTEFSYSAGRLLLPTLLLLTGLLLATLLLLTTLAGLRLAALLLLTTLLLTTLLLIELLVSILVHRSLPLQYWFAISIARFPSQESIRGSCIRSTLHLEENVSGTCPNLLSSL